MPIRCIPRWAVAVGGATLLALRGSAAEGQLPAPRFVRVAQSADAAVTNAAARALDGSTATFSLTPVQSFVPDCVGEGRRDWCGVVRPAPTDPAYDCG